MKYFSIWPPLEAALSVLKVSLSVNFFLLGSDTNKGDCHRYRITSFHTMSLLKKSVR